MSGQDLYADVLKVETQMDEAISDIKTYGLEMAERERDYRVAKSKETARLRLEDKAPVSIVADMANGNEKVADLRLERDKNEVLYKASIERLQKLKREHDLLKVFLTKELQ